MSEKFVQYGTSVLFIGSKNYSSWSLRPWLFLRKAGDPALREWQDASLNEGHPLPHVDQVGA
jgi:hypothetical protein